MIGLCGIAKKTIMVYLQTNTLIILNINLTEYLHKMSNKTFKKSSKFMQLSY